MWPRCRCVGGAGEREQHRRTAELAIARLNGVKFAMKPQTKPQVEIGGANLSDFYSRLVVTEQGRFNLQDVTGAAPEPRVRPALQPRRRRPRLQQHRRIRPPADAKPLPIDIKVGGVKLVNGRVDFSDHFVRPNYSAALTELNGHSARSAPQSRHGHAGAEGPRRGHRAARHQRPVEPTVKPLALDIKARATDLELAPLSPYAASMPATRSSAAS